MRGQAVSHTHARTRTHARVSIAVANNSPSCAPRPRCDRDPLARASIPVVVKTKHWNNSRDTHMRMSRTASCPVTRVSLAVADNSLRYGAHQTTVVLCHTLVSCLVHALTTQLVRSFTHSGHRPRLRSIRTTRPLSMHLCQSTTYKTPRGCVARRHARQGADVHRTTSNPFCQRTVEIPQCRQGIGRKVQDPCKPVNDWQLRPALLLQRRKCPACIPLHPVCVRTTN